jgi:hypothetical protein
LPACVALSSNIWFNLQAELASHICRKNKPTYNNLKGSVFVVNEQFATELALREEVRERRFGPDGEVFPKFVPPNFTVFERHFQRLGANQRLVHIYKMSIMLPGQ